MMDEKIEKYVQLLVDSSLRDVQKEVEERTWTQATRYTRIVALPGTILVGALVFMGFTEWKAFKSRVDEIASQQVERNLRDSGLPRLVEKSQHEYNRALILHLRSRALLETGSDFPNSHSDLSVDEQVSVIRLCLDPMISVRELWQVSGALQEAKIRFELSSPEVQKALSDVLEATSSEVFEHRASRNQRSPRPLPQMNVSRIAPTLRVLSQVGDPALEGVLLDILDSPSNFTAEQKLAAIRGLEILNSKAALPILKAIYANLEEVESVRAACLRYLARADPSSSEVDSFLTAVRNSELSTPGQVRLAFELASNIDIHVMIGPAAEGIVQGYMLDSSDGITLFLRPRMETGVPSDSISLHMLEDAGFARSVQRSIENSIQSGSLEEVKSAVEFASRSDLEFGKTVFAVEAQVVVRDVASADRTRCDLMPSWPERVFLVVRDSTLLIYWVDANGKAAHLEIFDADVLRDVRGARIRQAPAWLGLALSDSQMGFDWNSTCSPYY